MPHQLPPLPYTDSDLAPHISQQTVALHHGKHHQTYITNLNNLLKDNPLLDKSLAEIIMASYGKPDMVGVFNNAGQAWNHSVYWPSMKAGGGGKPSGDIAAKIDSDIGGYDKFVEEFKTAGTTQFGSGWAWLALDKNKKLMVVKTANADSPMTTGGVGLIGLDVWEHAYYLDYQNRRPDYIQTFLDKLLNWDYANENLKKSL
ncbi:MAG: superoxide dismutase [Alphaproteobacteria bacterium]